MIDYTQGAGVEYHIGISSKDIGRYVLLTGDPGRVSQIASYLDDAHKVQVNREYVTYTGMLEGVPVSVMSTGIGGPSTAIAVEELVHCQAHTLIRLGTCGGMDLNVMGGDLCIASGAVRAEGTTQEYAPLAFPAVPSFEVLKAQVQAAHDLALRAHVGVVHCKDSFYGQHEPLRSPVGQRLVQDWDAYCALGTMASEMESSTLFIVGQARHIRTGAMFMTIANQERAKQGLSNIQEHDLTPMFQCAVNTLKLLIQDDKKREA